MQPAELLNLMKSYFEGKQPPEVMQNFAAQSPRALLPESLDIVEFVVFLEEDLGREIDIQILGEALLTLNFGQLAEEVAVLAAGDAG